MSTHNIGFYEDLTKKPIFELSSNTHLISSAVLAYQKDILEHAITSNCLSPIRHKLHSQVH